MHKGRPIYSWASLLQNVVPINPTSLQNNLCCHLMQKNVCKHKYLSVSNLIPPTLNVTISWTLTSVTSSGGFIVAMSSSLLSSVGLWKREKATNIRMTKNVHWMGLICPFQDTNGCINIINFIHTSKWRHGLGWSLRHLIAGLDHRNSVAGLRLLRPAVGSSHFLNLVRFFSKNRLENLP